MLFVNFCCCKFCFASFKLLKCCSFCFLFFLFLFRLFALVLLLIDLNCCKLAALRNDLLFLVVKASLRSGSLHIEECFVRISFFNPSSTLLYVCGDSVPETPGAEQAPLQERGVHPSLCRLSKLSCGDHSPKPRRLRKGTASCALSLLSPLVPRGGGCCMVGASSSRSSNWMPLHAGLRPVFAHSPSSFLGCPIRSLFRGIASPLPLLLNFLVPRK